MKTCCGRRPRVPFFSASTTTAIRQLCLQRSLVQVDTTCGYSGLDRSSPQLELPHFKYWSRKYAGLFPASSLSRVSERQELVSAHSSMNIIPMRWQQPTVLICGISSADQEMQMEPSSAVKLVPCYILKKRKQTGWVEHATTCWIMGNPDPTI